MVRYVRPASLERRTRPRQDHGMTDAVMDHVIMTRGQQPRPLMRRMNRWLCTEWPMTHEVMGALRYGRGWLHL